MPRANIHQRPKERGKNGRLGCRSGIITLVKMPAGWHLGWLSVEQLTAICHQLHNQYVEKKLKQWTSGSERWNSMESRWRNHTEYTTNSHAQIQAEWLQALHIFSKVVYSGMSSWMIKIIQLLILLYTTSPPFCCETPTSTSVLTIFSTWYGKIVEEPMFYSSTEPVELARGQDMIFPGRCKLLLVLKAPRHKQPEKISGRSGFNLFSAPLRFEMNWCPFWRYVVTTRCYSPLLPPSD